MKRWTLSGCALLAFVCCTYLFFLDEEPGAQVTDSATESSRSRNFESVSADSGPRRDISNRRASGESDTGEITQEKFDDFQNASVTGSNSYDDFVSFLGKIQTEEMLDLAVGTLARAESLTGKEKASLMNVFFSLEGSPSKRFGRYGEALYSYLGEPIRESEAMDFIAGVDSPMMQERLTLSYVSQSVSSTDELVRFFTEIGNQGEESYLRGNSYERGKLLGKIVGPLARAEKVDLDLLLSNVEALEIDQEFKNGFINRADSDR